MMECVICGDNSAYKAYAGEWLCHICAVETGNTLEQVLVGAANLIEEITDPVEMRERDMTIEDRDRDVEILRTHELHPTGTRAELDQLRAQVQTLHAANARLVGEVDAARKATNGMFQCDGVPLDVQIGNIVETCAERLKAAELWQEIAEAYERAAADMRDERDKLRNAIERVRDLLQDFEQINDHTHGGGLAPLDVTKVKG